MSDCLFSDDAVNRLAWHLFTEHLDMDHEQTREDARRDWHCIRSGASVHARVKARIYLIAAATGAPPPEQ